MVPPPVTGNDVVSLLSPSSAKRKLAETEAAVSGKRRASIVPGREVIEQAVEEYVKKYMASKRSTDDSDTSPYPEGGIPNSYYKFNLSHGGIPEWRRQLCIKEAKEYHATQKSNFFGYQLNLNMDYADIYGEYLDTHVNNIGDAFVENNLTLNTKFMERAVLDYFAELWHAEYPSNKDNLESYWGFCLTMGSTEGNLYAMWNARDYLAGKKIMVSDNTIKVVRKRDSAGKVVSSKVTTQPQLVFQKPVLLSSDENPNKYSPIAFFSEDTHYSLTKGMTMLDIRTFYAEGNENYPNQCPLAETDGVWPSEVPSLESGAIDVDALEQLVRFFASKGHPIAVCFNYGTTFKGAYDDVKKACDKLKPVLREYGLLERKVYYDKDDPTKFDIRKGYWLHVDGALGAAYMPFVEMAYKQGLISECGPCFDFRLPMVNSIAMSGHKYIGAPNPCGVFMTRKKYQMLPPEIPVYIGSPDTTFAGSRNGLSAMILWDNISRHSYTDNVTKVLDLENRAAYAELRLTQLQTKLGRDLYVGRTPLALTIRFRRLNETLCKKYSISNEVLDYKKYSHIFVMDHVTTDFIDQFIDDISSVDAFDWEEISSETAESTADTAKKMGLVGPVTNRIFSVPYSGRGFP